MTAPKENYQRRLDCTLTELAAAGRVPTLLLHACCAPCSSYVLEYLNPHFDITLWYYNPNIQDEAEYRLRERELHRLVVEMPLSRPVEILPAPYDPARWREAVRGQEQEPEGGARCRTCFGLRLAEAAKTAAQGGFDFVTTTLTISPLKDAALLNTVGAKAAENAGVAWLYADFKKKEGYKRSCELSALYHLYRQSYCGCPLS